MIVLMPATVPLTLTVLPPEPPLTSKVSMLGPRIEGGAARSKDFVAGSLRDGISLWSALTAVIENDRIGADAARDRDGPKLETVPAFVPMVRRSLPRK